MVMFQPREAARQRRWEKNHQLPLGMLYHTLNCLLVALLDWQV
jgi:hypothetical protein